MDELIVKFKNQTTMVETIKNKEQIVQKCKDYTLFSWTAQGKVNPINVERGEGVYLYDRDGKRYIDFSSQLMNVNIGHGDKRVAEAVAKQMSEVSFVYPGMATDVRAQLGEKLAHHSPGNLKKTFFTLGGADAIENAIKVARVFTGRHKIITQYRSYHGGTYGAMTAGGDPRKFLLDSQQMPNVVHVENPYFYRCPWGSKTEEECAERAAANLERIVKYENPASIAAFIFEGESGSSGCIKYPKGYLKKAKAIAEKYGILYINDEVMSGFGRTGKMFAIEHHEVEPDIMCMAKGLTSGYLPLGGLIVKEEIAEFFNENYMPLGLTYSSHPVSVAAGLEVMNIYESDNLVERAAEMGKYMDQQVSKLREKHPSIGDFRNTGLLGCIELVKDRATKEPVTAWNAPASESEATHRISAKLRELGMFTFVKWNFVFTAPPLIISKEQIDEGLDIISQALSIADEYYTG